MASQSALGVSSNGLSVYVLVIVGKGDTPLYEADLSVTASNKREDTPHLVQFILHTALDQVDEAVWLSNSMYLKVVDSFNEFLVSAYVTAGHVKFMLLHKHRNDDAIRLFFQELHEYYIKTLMNPFYETNGLITSEPFDARVRMAAKRHLH